MGPKAAKKERAAPRRALSCFIPCLRGLVSEEVKLSPEHPQGGTERDHGCCVLTEHPELTLP